MNRQRIGERGVRRIAEAARHLKLVHLYLAVMAMCREAIGVHTRRHNEALDAAIRDFRDVVHTMPPPTDDEWRRIESAIELNLDVQRRPHRALALGFRPWSDFLADRE